MRSQSSTYETPGPGEIEILFPASRPDFRDGLVIGCYREIIHLGLTVFLRLVHHFSGSLPHQLPIIVKKLDFRRRLAVDNVDPVVTGLQLQTLANCRRIKDIDLLRFGECHSRKEENNTQHRYDRYIYSITHKNINPPLPILNHISLEKANRGQVACG